MNPVIQIDYREKCLIELLEDLPINQTNLDCGDIVFSINETPQILIERKSLSDLNSSISDGRYGEQKKRLCSNYTRNRIIYLVEGDMIRYSAKNDSKRVWSGILHTTFRDGIFVFRTGSINESAIFIRQLWERFSSKPNEWLEFLEGKGAEYAIQSENKVSTKKKENNTPRVVFINMLSQIGGVSSKIATSIVDTYPNMKTLISTLESDDGINQLSQIKIGTRKIGNVCAQRISKYLLNTD